MKSNDARTAKEAPSQREQTPSHWEQTASHWGVFNVETDADGRILQVGAFDADPSPPPIIHALPELVRSSLRIDQPYVRTSYLELGFEGSRGKRGAEPFVPVSWDAALTMIERELLRVRRDYGNESIYGGSYGWASAGRLHHSPSVLKRFLGLFGGYVDKLGNHSFGAALGLLPYVLGTSDVTGMVTPWPTILSDTRLFVLFGGAHIKNTQIDSGGTTLHGMPTGFEAARKAGIEFVNISPSRGDAMDALQAQWLAIRPNTDVALMLGLAHTLMAHDLHDRSFLARYCEGFERFADYLHGKSDGQAKDASWAARITGISAEAIRALALRMASTRTLIATSWSVQRADHGEQPVWMTITLAAMLGQIGLPGGGFSLGFGATSGIAAPRPASIPRPKLPLGKNPVTTHVPVACVTDMLLNPGKVIDYNGRTLRYPDIKLIYSVGGNPFHHASDLNAFLAGWQRPDTIIVHEPWWTPAARHADIVLPATTTMERNDILAAELDRHYIAMRRVIEPVGQARNDIDIFAELAERLGFGKAYTEGRDEMAWLRHMYEEARAIAPEQGHRPPPFDEFWRIGRYAFAAPSEPFVLLRDFREDPNGHALKTPSGRIEIFSATIEGFGYDDCPPHPVWLEPAEWLGSKKTERFPLHLLSNQPAARLHSQLDPASISRATKIADREPLAMHPADAAARGLRAGDVVRVFNDRGAFLAGLTIRDTLLPGVAQIATGAWFDPAEPGTVGSLEKHGNPNMVTMNKGTSKLTQSSVAQTVLVQVEKREGAPKMTAFEMPRIECLPGVT